MEILDKDKKIALKRQFLRYIHPLKSITNSGDQKECWIEQMNYLVQDFKTLLNLSFNEFWSTIVFNKQATIGLCSFLQDVAPPHLMDQFPLDDDMLKIYNEIDYFAYLLLKRLTTSSENEENHMSPHYMWALLCDNNIINIPLLFNICSIYGQSYKKDLEKMFNELFSCQKMYNDNLRNFTQITMRCLSQFQDKIELDFGSNNYTFEKNKTIAEIEKNDICMIEDTILFLLDTSYSISNFLEIYPPASGIFYEEKLHLKIASFYHSIKPLIYEKVINMNMLEQFEEKLQASRLLLVKIVQQCLIHLTNEITKKRESETAVHEYFEVITELLAYSEFINDYNFTYNLAKDIKTCQKVNKEIDTARFDNLLKSLALFNISNNELEQKQINEEQLKEQISKSNLENAKLQSLVNDVKDLLPHIGNGFIQKCLEYYDMSSEKVINSVLDGSLPSELTQYDFSLSTISEYDVENNATGYDVSAKGNKKLKKLKAVLDDKTFRNEMRPFYEKYNFTEVTSAELKSCYDDEFDDTYEVEYEVPIPADENEKRRPDVMPRILLEKEVVSEQVEKEFSDDEPPPVLVNFKPFCENPEDVRERQARRYAAKQSNRSNQSKPKATTSTATPSGSNVQLKKQQKNENKAFHGNHNRRNAARNKQQRGMF